MVRSQSGKTVYETLSRKKPITKIGLVEWLKVQALSSNPSMAKKKKEFEKNPIFNLRMIMNREMIKNQTIWASTAAHTSHPSYLGVINRKIEVQASPGENTRTYLKNRPWVQTTIAYQINNNNK
jgi:hypothetical protein